MTDSPRKRRVSVVLFEGFELLDVFGPVELLSHAPHVTMDYVGPHPGPVRSSQGAQIMADLSYPQLATPDIVLVPGGTGTRRLVTDKPFLSWLAETGEHSQLVVSVCTGSAVLAAAGLLEGYRATSNKLAFTWASSFGRNVGWEPHARWVEDGDRWTSSGVAAGMDMTVALIASLFGPGVREAAVIRAEYQPQTDSTVDPFAQVHGLA